MPDEVLVMMYCSSHRKCLAECCKYVDSLLNCKDASTKLNCWNFLDLDDDGDGSNFIYSTDEDDF